MGWSATPRGAPPPIKIMLSRTPIRGAKSSLMRPKGRIAARPNLFESSDSKKSFKKTRLVHRLHAAIGHRADARIGCGTRADPLVRLRAAEPVLRHFNLLHL